MSASCESYLSPERQACLQAHIGPWAIELQWFGEALAALRAGKWAERVKPPIDQPLYQKIGNGVALLEVTGQTQKGWSKYGGTSSLALRRGLRSAAADPEVRGIFMLVDSPGGTVAGTGELASEVNRVRATGMPVVAHADDLMASAAYWVGSQTDRITASPTSEIGSIGTMAVLEDTSGKAALEGIKVYVVATGALKGAGMPGTPIEGEHLAYVADRVADSNEHFLKAVASGRSVTPTYARTNWGSGQVWIASKAKEIGLIDQVMGVDQAIDTFAKSLRSRKAPVDTKGVIRKKALEGLEYHALRK